MKLYSYAYNNVANQQIYAGQTLNNDNFNSIKFNVLPNPISDNFQIENNSNITDLTITLTDINGKKITLESTDNIFNTTTLNPGVYFLRIEDSEGRLEIKKIIKK